MNVAALSAKLSPNAHHATDWFRDHDEESLLVTDDGYPAAAESAARAVGNTKVLASDLALWAQIIRAQLGTRAPAKKRAAP
jgi:hypothetical protein